MFLQVLDKRECAIAATCGARSSTKQAACSSVLRVGCEGEAREMCHDSTCSRSQVNIVTQYGLHGLVLVFRLGSKLQDFPSLGDAAHVPEAWSAAQ